jgi:allantoicase
MKVHNMENQRGNKVANQFIIEDGGITYFQSYKTVIAKKDATGQVFLDLANWDYSSTTSKYRNIFLGEKTEVTRGKIKSREYVLDNLN